MNVPRLDRFAGCLVGQALGDALGAPMRGRTAQECAAYVQGSAFGRIGVESGRFGQYTVDTRLARELVRSWLEARRFDPAKYGRRIALVLASNATEAGETATMAAAGRLAQGAPWHLAGAPPPAAGSGSAARAAPVGLLCWADLHRLVVVACDQSRVTHADPRARAGAVAVASAVAFVLRAVPRHPDMLEQIAALCDPVDASFATSVRWLADVCALPVDDAAAAIANRDRPAGHARATISAFVVPTVLWALYAFLTASDDELFLDAVRIAVMPGGNVGATAALAGALAGASVGLEALPALALQVTDRGAWGYDDLVELGRAIGQLALGPC